MDQNNSIAAFSVVHGVHMFSVVYYTLYSCMLLYHRNIESLWNKHRHTLSHSWALKSRKIPKIQALIFTVLYILYLTQAAGTLKRKTERLTNKDALSDSRFCVVELSLTFRQGRDAAEKQRVIQGKFLPGIHECLNTTGMQMWNLHDCHDNCRYEQDKARSFKTTLWWFLFILIHYWKPAETSGHWMCSQLCYIKSYLVCLFTAIKTLNHPNMCVWSLNKACNMLTSAEISIQNENDMNLIIVLNKQWKR